MLAVNGLSHSAPSAPPMPLKSSAQGSGCTSGRNETAIAASLLHCAKILPESSRTRAIDGPTPKRRNAPYSSNMQAKENSLVALSTVRWVRVQVQRPQAPIRPAVGRGVPSPSFSVSIHGLPGSSQVCVCASASQCQPSVRRWPADAKWSCKQTRLVPGDMSSQEPFSLCYSIWFSAKNTSPALNLGSWRRPCCCASVDAANAVYRQDRVFLQHILLPVGVTMVSKWFSVSTWSSFL